MSTAKRLDGIGEYYFSQKLREIEAMNKTGKDVINLGIGSPDMPPHSSVINVLHSESAKATTHAYQSYKGSPVLRNAIADWYKKWYNTTLNPDEEILPLIGSKEGILHICMTYFQEGDAVLVPDLGYPTYASAVRISGATPLFYDLKAENNYYPDFEQLEILMDEAKQLHAVKAIFINYPHMPTGQLPTVELFKNFVAFAKKHSILIVHDNPYSFILNKNPLSILTVDGAKEVAVELNSLSKSHNMAGWRVGMLCGAKQRIDDVLRFKSNMDSGMFLPVQLAAVAALKLDNDWFESVNEIYIQRRQKVFELLDILNCMYDKTQVGMFVWAKVPEDCKDGFALSDKILKDANVFITPGGIFGSNGNSYIRVSLCANEEKIAASVNRIKQII